MGKKTELAKELIIREIWDMGLKCGDQLPSCGILSRRVNLGRATVFRAVKELQEEGILDSRDRVGVFIADPRTPGHAGYQIGLIIGNMNSSPFNNQLSVYLQSRCMESGCRCLMFHASEVLHDTTQKDSLSAHVGVCQQIERGELHGLLTQIAFSPENSDFLRRHRIPYCFVGGFSPAAAQLSVVISLEKVIRLGLERLVALGSRRPLLLIPRGRWKAMAENIAGSYGGKCLVYPGICDMASVAEQILHLPESECPDGIMIPDDYAAQFLCSSLTRSGCFRKVSRIAVLASAEQQLPPPAKYLLPFPIETEILTFSITELARLATDLLLKNMRNYSPEKQELELSLEWRKNTR